MLKSNTRSDFWVNNNRITLLLRRATGKQPWTQKFPAEEQKWSPETHAVNFRHDNNSKKKKSTDLMMLSPAGAARVRRAGAERSPFLRQSRLLWRAEAEQQSTLGGAQTRTGPVIGRLLEETRTRDWAETHFYGLGGNEAERGGKREERAFQHDSRTLEAVGEAV